ncbi:MAG: tetratricopeptide repeat protein [Planctomycetaceae bacterium]|nr:tetratricopeptide repeat protein [Planctomycetaceae bacterium]
MNVRHAQLLCFVICVFVSGCNSFKSLTAQGSRDTVEEDPLERSFESSPEFKLTKKYLNKPAKAQLAYALWREEQGDYEGAIRRYQDVLADDAKNIEARLGIARVEQKTGRKAQALKILEATVRKFPDSQPAWMELGRLHRSEENLEKSIVSFRRSVKLTPEDQMANYELGVSLAMDDQFEEAHEYLTTASGESAASYNIGYLLKEDGRLSEAESWLQRALASRPDELTKDRATKELALLQQRTDGTMLAETRQPAINRERTRFTSYTESPDQSGFEAVASLKADHSAGRASQGQQSLQASQTGGVAVLSGGQSPQRQSQSAGMSTTRRSAVQTASGSTWSGNANTPSRVQPVSGVRAGQSGSLPQWQPGVSGGQW